MAKSPKYTRRHYLDIGNLIRQLPATKRRAEFDRWDATFSGDNPYYQSQKFSEYVFGKKKDKKWSNRRGRWV